MPHSANWTQLDSKRSKYVHTWEPATPALATVCIVHGLGEHGGRYHRLATDLIAAGIRVHAFDQQGHGKSPEPRGCVESYESLLEDIDAFLSWAKVSDDLPTILFGHSMGGNLVINYALRKEALPTAVISSSPMLRATRPPHWLAEKLLRALSKIAPNYRLKSVPRAERLMSDPTEQQLLRDDELFHSRLSLRLGGALLDTGHWAIENASELNVPTLLTHGTQDYLTCHLASQEFASRAGQHCQLQILPDRLHDPFRDQQRDAVIAKFVDFIAGHIDQPF